MNKIIFYVIGILLFLQSCSQEPIFADIEKEIKLRDQTVKNYIYSVVEFENNFYVAHLGLRTKPKESQDGWSPIAAPGKVIRLAVAKYTANQYLYLLTDTWKVFYKTAQSEWTEVNGISGSVKTIFGDGKNAWVVAGDGAYKLEGNKVAVAKEAGSDTDTLAGSLADYATTGKATFSKSVVFAYNHENRKVYETKDIEKHVSGATAATYYNDGSKKWLIVGINGGIRRILLDQDGTIPQNPTVTTNDLANASTTIGPYDVFSGAVYAFDNNSLFVGIYDYADSKVNGLWGYYPSRGSWNRE